MNYRIRLLLFTVLFLPFSSMIQGMKRKNSNPQRSISLKQEGDTIVFSLIDTTKEEAVIKEIERIPRNSYEKILMLMHYRSMPIEIKNHVTDVLLAPSIPDVFQCTAICQIEGHGMRSVKFSPNNRNFITDDYYGENLHLWDSENYLPRQFSPPPGEKYGFIRFNFTGSMVVLQQKEGPMNILSVPQGDLILGPLLFPYPGITKHNCRINEATFSPDSSLVFIAYCGGCESFVWVYSIISGECLLKMDVMNAQLSPDGKTLLACLPNDIYQLWDPTKKQLLHTLKGAPRSRGYMQRRIHFSPNSQTALTGSGTSALCLRDIKTGHALQTFNVKSESLYGKFSPDSKFLLVSYNSHGTAQSAIYNARTGELLHTLQKNTLEKKLLLNDESFIPKGRFSPDGTLAFTTYLESTVDLWDTKTGELLSSFNSPFGIEKVKISPNNNFIALISKESGNTDDCKDRKLYVINRAQQEQIIELNLDPTDRSPNPVFSPDSSTILVPRHEKYGVSVMSTKTGNILHTIDAESDVCYIGFNHDGTKIITGSTDNKLRFWKHVSKLYPWTEKGQLTIFQAWLINKIAGAAKIKNRDNDTSFIIGDSLVLAILQTMPEGVIQCLRRWYSPRFKIQINEAGCPL
ncbi:hypothetical protein H0X06_05270 [Candidatus Dependentiae bacterium]|nr:hypothetical protein [Candidatus Dependentiae bacterium]